MSIEETGIITNPEEMKEQDIDEQAEKPDDRTALEYMSRIINYLDNNGIASKEEIKDGVHIPIDSPDFDDVLASLVEQEAIKKVGEFSR